MDFRYIDILFLFMMRDGACRLFFVSLVAWPLVIVNDRDAVKKFTVRFLSSFAVSVLSFAFWKAVPPWIAHWVGVCVQPFFLSFFLQLCAVFYHAMSSSFGLGTRLVFASVIGGLVVCFLLWSTLSRDSSSIKVGVSCWCAYFALVGGFIVCFVVQTLRVH